MDNQVYLKNVATLKYDLSKCTGCGICVEVCPHGVFKMTNKKASVTNLDKCMECGACKLNCQSNAIFVKTGVGCAAAIINGFINKSEPNCGCGGPKDVCCN
jgi:NAD-dependent dihydropyrimidine dehydrogenase PreA subunit